MYWTLPSKWTFIQVFLLVGLSLVYFYARGRLSACVVVTDGRLQPAGRLYYLLSSRRADSSDVTIFISSRREVDVCLIPVISTKRLYVLWAFVLIIQEIRRFSDREFQCTFIRTFVPIWSSILDVCSCISLYRFSYEWGGFRLGE